MVEARIKGITIRIRGILRSTKEMGISSLGLTMVVIATTKVVEISLEGMEYGPTNVGAVT